MLPNPKLRVLVGRLESLERVRGLAPYDDRVLEFVATLSQGLMADAEAKEYGDIVAFAFWCRKANLAKLKREFDEPRVRLGVGTVFHITPSNVPVNFAFSYVFALLAGNASLVRVPTKDFAQVRIITRVLNALLAEQCFALIADMTVMVRYEQDDLLTSLFSGQCNARLIWGGDQAIANIRKFRIPERAIEVVFADRFSFCVINASALLAIDTAALSRLAGGFYNDTFLMDQNACSSPHLVVWLGAGRTVAEAKARFWGALQAITTDKYELQAVNAVDKYVLLCRNAAALEGMLNFERHGNFLYRVDLETLPENIDSLRGNCGYFFEYDSPSLEDIAHIVNAKYQTLTYFGVPSATLVDFVVSNGLSGIDRIVPVGTALDIGVIWDGYDVVRSLSRIVDVV